MRMVESAPVSVAVALRFLKPVKATNLTTFTSRQPGTVSAPPLREGPGFVEAGGRGA